MGTYAAKTANEKDALFRTDNYGSNAEWQRVLTLRWQRPESGLAVERLRDREHHARGPHRSE